MAPEIEQQFKRGSGGELGRKSKPGKMSSLRSSSALSFNFFAPWDNSDLTSLGGALGVSVVDRRVVFERQFDHGLESIPPNIDVVLDAGQRRPLGVECKFTEPYGKKALHPCLASKYFDGDHERWGKYGLKRCQELARAIGHEVAFRRLGAGQLLKHILGLTHTTNAPARLLCVWYDNGSDEASEHRTELNQFRQLIDPSVDFLEVTYQGAFAALGGVHEPVTGWKDYMTSRYFAA